MPLTPAALALRQEKHQRLRDFGFEAFFAWEAASAARKLFNQAVRALTHLLVPPLGFPSLRTDEKLFLGNEGAHGHSIRRFRKTRTQVENTFRDDCSAPRVFCSAAGFLNTYRYLYCISVSLLASPYDP